MAKSIAKNALYSGARTISIMLFPLVTYPYVTRVLLADNLGKVDFSISITSYFVLLAGLGITNYATREGARVREHRDELDKFSSEVFSINIVSTLISYLLLAALYVAWPHLQDYGLLMAIQAFSIIGTTIGVEWLYTLSEDFGYITARTFIMQVVSAILLFTLVKQPSDYHIYAAITVFSSVGANVFNFMRAKRYATIKFVVGFDYRRHLIPMLVLFGNALAVSVYINIDVTILNVFRSDYEVGIYSVSVKIYKLAKQLLNAIITVSIPRLSLYLANGKHDRYEGLLSSALHALLIATLPAVTLMFLSADYIVLIVGGEAFAESAETLRILCFAMVPALLATLVANAILLTNRQEHLILRSTIVGAVVNLGLNLCVIPLFGASGAAATTAIAETTVFAMALRYGRPHYDPRLFRELVRPCATTLFGCAVIAVSYLAINSLMSFSIITFLVSSATALLLYVAVLLLARDSLTLSLASKVLRRR